MINSLRLYTGYFIKTALLPERNFIVHDCRRMLQRRWIDFSETEYDEISADEALDKAAGWLLHAQRKTGDHGIGSYHLAQGWSSSYPETTGYIIPTLIKFGTAYQRQDALDAAVGAADFLVSIQKESGGWQGGRMKDQRPEIVFNTGQVVRGMIAVAGLAGEKKYLEAAAKAGDWLCRIQHPGGFWKAHALMNEARVYDTYVDAPLLQLFKATGNSAYRDAALRNLDWAVDEKMLENGWFEDCDNTIKRNHKPILHTIAYTLDGLIECGKLAEDDKYIAAAKKGADTLREIFLSRGYLNGRFDKDWRGSEHFICTGGAQMAIVWLALFHFYKDEAYLHAAGKMLRQLTFIQARNFRESDDTLGAIPGSFPLWGRYEPFALPNWATKFFCDALLLYKETRS